MHIMYAICIVCIFCISCISWYIMYTICIPYVPKHKEWTSCSGFNFEWIPLVHPFRCCETLDLSKTKPLPPLSAKHNDASVFPASAPKRPASQGLNSRKAGFHKLFNPSVPKGRVMFTYLKRRIGSFGSAPRRTGDCLVACCPNGVAPGITKSTAPYLDVKQKCRLMK